jgi:putative ABC transport system permease protein
MLTDLRFALRQLRKAPAFAATALLTVALAVGVNAAVFSVVYAVLLRPLPFPQPHELMLVWMSNPREAIEKDVTSWPMFSDWRAQSQRFEHMAAHFGFNATITGRGEPVQVPAQRVSHDFFDLFGTAPLRGRTFEQKEFGAGRNEVVVLSHALWQQRFGAQPAIGETLTVNGSAHTIVGVMPPAFKYPEETAFWTPLAPTGNTGELMKERGSLWLTVVGRLRDGQTREGAQDEMDTIAARLAQQYPSDARRGVLLEPLHQAIVGDTRVALVVLLGAVAFVLLIACANLANLLLARAAARHREVAIRQALGAGRRRLIRQLLVESLVLGIGGGLAGLLLAWWGLDALLAATPPGLPRVDDIRLDGTVLAFTAGLSILTALIFGVAPAVQYARGARAADLKEGARGETDSPRALRLRAALVVAEIAIALMLVAGAGLMVRSMRALDHVDLGIETRSVVAARLQLPPTAYPPGEPVVRFYEDLVERLERDGRVQSAGAISTMLLSRLPNSAILSVEGRPPAGPDEVRVPVPYDAVTPGFYRTVGIRLLDGRLFTPDDAAGKTPVTIVNEALAREYFPGERALGRRVTFGSPTSDRATWLRIVGVVSDARRSGPDQPPRAEVYFPHRQDSSRTMTVVARARENASAAAAALRESVRSVDPNLPVTVRHVPEIVAEQVATRRFVLLLLGSFAGLALVLAIVGTYGVVSYSTVRRTSEFGVRLALGAAPRQVRQMVMGQALRLAAVGVAIGLAGAALTTRALETFLFAVRPADASTFGVAAMLLVAATAAAAYLPARRATRIDPSTALRTE